MSKKLLVKGVALACALTFVAAACGDDGGTKATDTTTASSTGATTGATTGGSTGATTTAPAKSSGLLTDTGPCKTDLPGHPAGLITVLESPVLSVVDQGAALTASVKAFNARG